MPDRLSVGYAANCTAPLQLDLFSMRFCRFFGIDSFFVPDHYLGLIPRVAWKPEFTPAASMVPSADAFFDPFVMTGMMATRHRRVRIGTSVTEAYRRHPATLAQAFLTLDHLTRGRAILGIGNGERENTEPYGIPFVKRVARLEEALVIIRRLWESGGEPIDFDGSFWQLKRALFATPLYQGKPPAVWVAAHAPRMLRLAGRHGDGWYPTYRMSPADYQERLRQIYAAGVAAGRSMANFEPALQIGLAIGKNRATVLEQVVKAPISGAMGLLLSGALWKQHGLQHPLGEDYEGFPDLLPENITLEQVMESHRLMTPELVGDSVFAGNLDEVVTAIRSLVEVGVRHVVLWNLGPIVMRAGLPDVLRLGVLIRRLRKLPLAPRSQQ